MNHDNLIDIFLIISVFLIDLLYSMSSVPHINTIK
jgi:hypothetical protein